MRFSKFSSSFTFSPGHFAEFEPRAGIPELGRVIHSQERGRNVLGVLHSERASGARRGRGAVVRFPPSDFTLRLTLSEIGFRLSVFRSPFPALGGLVPLSALFPVSGFKLYAPAPRTSALRSPLSGFGFPLSAFRFALSAFRFPLSDSCFPPSVSHCRKCTRPSCLAPCSISSMRTLDTFPEGNVTQVLPAALHTWFTT